MEALKAIVDREYGKYVSDIFSPCIVVIGKVGLDLLEWLGTIDDVQTADEIEDFIDCIWIRVVSGCNTESPRYLECNVSQNNEPPFEFQLNRNKPVNYHIYATQGNKVVYERVGQTYL